MLEERELGPEAIVYIRSCLSQGDTLAEHLLRLPLEEGRITAWLPAAVSNEVSRRFDTGGVIAPGSGAESIVTTFISTYLSKPGKRYGVFETFATSGDHSIAHPEVSFFIHETEVYYFLTSRDLDPEKITKTVRSARQFPFIGVLTSVPQGEPDVQPNCKVGMNVLEKLVSGTEYILISAYDGEGELIWRKG